MNVIIINPDQMRWDYSSPGGHPFIETAGLNRLCATGTHFANAFTVSPMCGPSRTSFLTSQYPIEHGVRNYAGTMHKTETGLDVFAKAGYRRGLFGKDHTIFDDAIGRLYDEGEDVCIGNMDDHPNYRNSWDSGPLAPDSPFNLTERLTTAAIDFMRRCNAQKTPFYATVNYQDPHPYFACPEPYASLFHPDQFQVPQNYRTNPTDGEPRRLTAWRQHSGSLDMSEAELRSAMAHYCGQIRYVDDQLIRVLDCLDELGIADDTIVVFWSDHGEFLGDFGVTHKCAAFYDCLTRIPLIIRDPQRRFPSGSDDRLVETVDVMPTLLELAGLPIHQDSRGRSLVSGNARSDVLAEAGLYAHQPEPIDGYQLKAPHDPSQWGPGTMLRTKRWKLSIYADGDGELFDLVSDPHEMTNLFWSTKYETVRTALSLRMLNRQQCQGQDPADLPTAAREVFTRNPESYPGRFEDYPKLVSLEVAQSERKMDAPI